MQGAMKGLHLFLGFLLNVFAFFIMIVPNSWATFQASPVVITEGSMWAKAWAATRSEEHTSELQSRLHLVCRLLLEKKKKINTTLHRRSARKDYYQTRNP